MADLSDLNDDQRQVFEAVRRQAETASGGTVNMWSLGDSLGLDRGRTEDAFMGLVGEGLLEIKSLSGGVVLTEAGQAAAGPVEESPAQAGLGEIIDVLKKELTKLDLPAGPRSDLEIDLGVLRAQQERSRPLPEVIRAVAAAMEKTIRSGAGQVPEAIQTALENLADAG